MNKKVLALAVTSALAGTAAQADTVNVNVYGRLYPQLQTESSSGATAAGPTPSDLGRDSTGENVPTRQDVVTSNSRIGFRGDADIGGGMKGWFQIESRLRFEDGNGLLSSRNSAAGLSGGFGDVYLGRWDTVYKRMGGPVSFIGLSSGNFVSNASVLSKMSFGTSNAARFHTRRNRSIHYDSPDFNGLQFGVTYGPDGEKTDASNQDLLSLGVKWEQGPIYVALARETLNDNFGGSRNADPALGIDNRDTAGTSSEDTATRLSAAYRVSKALHVGFQVSRLEYEESGQAVVGAFDTYETTTYAVTLRYRAGKFDSAVEFTRAGEGDCTLFGGVPCSTAGLDANMIAIGTRYNFDRRVSLFALAAVINNGESAEHGLVSDVEPGSDPRAIAAGIVVNF